MPARPRHALGVDSGVNECLGLSGPINDTPLWARLPSLQAIIVWCLRHGRCAAPVPGTVETELKFQGGMLSSSSWTRLCQGRSLWVFCVDACRTELKWNTWTKVTRLPWKPQVIILSPTPAPWIKLFYNLTYKGLVRLPHFGVKEVTTPNNELICPKSPN